MNRAERRRRSKEAQSKTKIWTLTEEQLKTKIAEAYQEDLEIARKEAINFATDRTLVAFLYCLREEFGFGRSRLQQMVHKIEDTFDKVNSGELTINELADYCEDVGVRVFEPKKEEQQ